MSVTSRYGRPVECVRKLTEVKATKIFVDLGYKGNFFKEKGKVKVN